MRFVQLPLALVIAGCYSAPVLVADRLTLKIADAPAEIRAGEKVAVTLEVRNVSTRHVRACLGHATGLTLRDSQFRTSGEIQTVDHPDCEQKFELEPGEVLRLGRTMQTAPLLKAGAGVLSAFVTLVSPPCAENGCRSDALKAATEVTILEGKFP